MRRAGEGRGGRVRRGREVRRREGETGGRGREGE